ncbi:MAG: carboxypeptidase-like regulatory domain-containing protein, partial [Alistipes sp.]|nr:carboxypeptidase-like regulatory domain-containing protein [Alistipes sp.]
MKRLIFTLMFILLATAWFAASVSAQQLSVSGRVVSSESEPIPYATVVLLSNDKQIAGNTTNNDGYFTLRATAGEYEVNISYIGYKSIKQTISLNSNLNLGDIILEEDAENIDEVVVTAQLIRREADRFVVDVANSPIAMGKDGEELLKSAPGIWIQDDKISINGSSGSKIYLNDREVKLDDAQLIAYLR